MVRLKQRADTTNKRYIHFSTPDTSDEEGPLNVDSEMGEPSEPERRREEEETRTMESPTEKVRRREEEEVRTMESPTETERRREEEDGRTMESPTETQRRVEQEDEGTEVLQPLKMYFSPTYYRETIKIANFCYIYKAVEKINTLDEDERRWFHEHPQLKHFFHMPLEEHHRMQGMSMLVLRAACTDKKKECWFVVNGVPVRYSLREHALISGLYCHPYPESFDTLGSLEFVNQQFPGVKRVTYKVVEQKLLSMGRCVERLNMAVLYFLSSVVIGQKRKGVGAPSVEPFFLRAVNDLELCRTFPWGRLAFDANMRDIFHMLDHFNGVPIPHWGFPSFITSLELLPYEAILCLKKKCRDDVIGAHRECPRMCKMSFKPISMRGWPISELNEALGTSKHIDSILEPTLDEELLLARIMADLDLEQDAIDPIVDGWKQRLMIEQRRVYFEELYNKDVAGRAGEYVEEAEETENENPENENMAAENDAPASEVPADLVMVEKRLTEAMEKGFKLINDRVDDLVYNMDTRMKDVENFVKERRGEAVKGGQQEAEKEGGEAGERGQQEAEKEGGESGEGGQQEAEKEGGESGEGGQQEVGEEGGEAGDRGPNGVGDGVGEDGDGAPIGAEEMEVQAEEKEGDGDGLEAEDMEVEAQEDEEKPRYVNGMLVVDDEPLLVSGMRCSEVKMVNGKRYKFLNRTEYYPSCMPGVPLLYARNSRKRRGGSGSTSTSARGTCGKTRGGKSKGKPLWK